MWSGAARAGSGAGCRQRHGFRLRRRCYFDTAAAPGRPVADGVGELAAVDRLGDVVVHAGGQTLLRIALHGVGGHGDDRHVGPAAVQAPDRGGRLEPVHLRHLDVHEDEIVGKIADRLDRFPAVGGDIDAVAQLGDQAGGDLLVDLIVLGHQDAQAAGGHGRLSRGAGNGGPVFGGPAKQFRQPGQQRRVAQRLVKEAVHLDADQVRP